MFPYPPEVNGGSYRIPFIERLKEISVSVPSRGEWGVLLKKRRAMKTTKSKFPSSLEGEWGVLPSRKTTRRVLEEMFPYPREVIGGSYADLHNPKALEGQFPPPLGVNRDS